MEDMEETGAHSAAHMTWADASETARITGKDADATAGISDTNAAVTAGVAATRRREVDAADGGASLCHVSETDRGCAGMSDASGTAGQSTPSEEQVADLTDYVLAHPRHRELLYKALSLCIDPRDEHEVEDYLEGQSEYADALQDAHVLLRTLVRHGGLVRTALDVQGRELTDELLDQIARDRGLGRALDNDEVADLTASHRVGTTPAGAAVVALLDPQRRIASCVEAVPERTNAFLSILQLCEGRPSTLGAIKELVRDDPALEPTARTAHLRLEASYFIDRLSEAGALVWDGGWRTTPAGERYLASA